MHMNLVKGLQRTYMHGASQLRKLIMVVHQGQHFHHHLDPFINLRWGGLFRCSLLLVRKGLPLILSFNILLSNSVIEIYHKTVKVILNVLLDETKFTSCSVSVCTIGIKFQSITNHLPRTKFILSNTFTFLELLLSSCKILIYDYIYRHLSPVPSACFSSSQS